MSEALQKITDFVTDSPLKAGLAVAVGLGAVYYGYKATRPVPQTPPGAVCLVTGCDSGIANATAKRLSGKLLSDGTPEFKVLAGCLTQAGIEELKALNRPNLVSFELDVCSDDSVKNMARLADKECGDKGLFGWLRTLTLRWTHF
jgi:hypothetical protein